MMNGDVLELLTQMSFLSSVLAGFAIAAAIQLVSLSEKKPLISATVAAFLLSSVISATATVIFVFVMTSMIGPPGSPRPSEDWIIHFVGGIGVLPALGLLFFLVGIGLVGWLQSRLLGILTTVSAVLASSVVVYVLRSISASQ